MRSVKSILFIFLLCSQAYAQTEPLTTIKVNIIHGSKPLNNSEYITIGGMYGGHITIQIDTFYYGFFFDSDHIHIFPHHGKNSSGVFSKQGITDWKKEFKTYKVTTIEIPVSQEQIDELQNQYESYIKQSPYDYAFFGMRCASSAYWVLGNAGIIKKCSRGKSIRKAFHPKAFRKKLEKTAVQKGYKITVQKGRKTRKWEGG